MKFTIAVVSLLLTLAACAEQPPTQGGSLMAQQDQHMSMDKHQSMSGCMTGMAGDQGAMKGCPMMMSQDKDSKGMSGCMAGMMSGGQGGMMGGQGGMMGCPMMSQGKEAKGMSCCCGNMGKEQPKDPA